MRLTAGPPLGYGNTATTQNMQGMAGRVALANEHAASPGQTRLQLGHNLTELGGI